MKYITKYVIVASVVLIILPMFATKSCDIIPFKANEVYVSVYLHKEKKIRKMPLEDYVAQVVAAEMPADFEKEALKAQAIAARTYVFGRMKGLYGSPAAHEGADICTDFAHCQAWVSKEDAYKKLSKEQKNKNWDRIEKAVYETRGLVLFYNQKIINPLFHSNAGGQTENVEEVWDAKECPYLKKIESVGDCLAPDYFMNYTFEKNRICELIKKEYPDFKISGDSEFISIIEISSTQRIKKIKVGNIILKGTKFRKILDLRSTKFKIECLESQVKITTLGNGHGVGMSQWGANYLAKNGKNSIEILKHYYSGIKIANLK